jgi:transcriptional regulator with XRE-family HTH domain
MTKRNPLVRSPPYPVESALTALGANLRTARLRRGLSIQEIAERISVDRRSVADAERGKPSTSVVVYIAILWVLGLVNQFEHVADPTEDREGLALAAQREPKRARRKETLDNDF